MAQCTTDLPDFFSNTDLHHVQLSPAELFLGHRFRSRLDCLQPSIQRVLEKQLKHKEDHDRHCRAYNFAIGEEVFLWNFGQGERGLPGHIRAQTSPLSFEIYTVMHIVVNCPEAIV